MLLKQMRTQRGCSAAGHCAQSLHPNGLGNRAKHDRITVEAHDQSCGRTVKAPPRESMREQGGLTGMTINEVNGDGDPVLDRLAVDDLAKGVDCRTGNNIPWHANAREGDR